MGNSGGKSEPFFSSEIWKKVIIGVTGAVILASLAFLSNRILEINSHVDSPVTASQLNDDQGELDSKITETKGDVAEATEDILGKLDGLANEIKGQREDLDEALEKVEKYKRKVDSAYIRGRASRQIGVDQIGKNEVYFNIHSSAAFLKYGDEVEIIGNSREIKATVAGKIMNHQEPDVLIMMNRDAAEAYGLSEKRGITDKDEIGIRIALEDAEHDNSS